MNGEEQQMIPMEAEPQYMPMGAGYPSDVTKFMLDTKKQLNEFEHQLRGEEFVNGKWVQIGTPILNQEGAKKVVGYTRGYVTRTTFLSNLKQEEVYDLTKNFSFNITQLIFNNGEEWAIDWDRANQGFIVDTTSDIVFMSLARAMGQGERTFLGKSTHVQHHIQDAPQQRKEKKFGLF
jgi:hypothetical protein